MTLIKPGDTVRIHYTGTLEDGTVFDSSTGRPPLEFTVGSGQIIRGLDRALPGMAVGERKTVTIAPEDAYGPRREGATQNVPRDLFPTEIPLEVGTALQMRGADGRPISVTITEVTADSVTLDANHRLAGKTLLFAFEIVSVG